MELTINIWYIVAIEIVLFMLAGFCSAVQDVVDQYWTKTIFHFKLLPVEGEQFGFWYLWWRSRGADKYVDGDIHGEYRKITEILPFLGKIKFFKTFRIPPQIVDAWHTFKYIKLILFYLSALIPIFFLAVGYTVVENYTILEFVYFMIQIGFFLSLSFWLGFEPQHSVTLLVRGERFILLQGLWKMLGVESFVDKILNGDTSGKLGEDLFFENNEENTLKTDMVLFDKYKPRHLKNLIDSYFEDDSGIEIINFEIVTDVTEVYNSNIEKDKAKPLFNKIRGLNNRYAKSLRKVEKEKARNIL